MWPRFRPSLLCVCFIHTLPSSWFNSAPLGARIPHHHRLIWTAAAAAVAVRCITTAFSWNGTSAHWTNCSLDMSPPSSQTALSSRPMLRLMNYWIIIIRVEFGSAIIYSLPCAFRAVASNEDSRIFRASTLDCRECAPATVSYFDRIQFPLNILLHFSSENKNGGVGW